MRFRIWVPILTLALVAGFAVSCSKSPKAETNPAAGEGGGQVGDVDITNPTPGGAETNPDPSEALEDVFFDYDRYEIRADARRALQANATYLRGNAMLSVELEGHCDERGTTEYNLALGQRRADAVKAYLRDLGVDAGRMTTVSYGEEKPFSLGGDEQAWAQNRRVHFNPSAS